MSNVHAILERSLNIVTGQYNSRSIRQKIATQINFCGEVKCTKISPGFSPVLIFVYIITHLLS